MQLSIIIPEGGELDMLNKVAGLTGLSAEQYATNIVRGWLQDQIRGAYVKYAREAPLSDLKDALKMKVKEV